MHQEILDKLICPVCQSEKDLKLHVFHAKTENIVKDGLITCISCKTWYPIQDQLLEFLIPELQYQEDVQAFYTQYQTEIEALGLKPNEIKVASVKEQQKQRDHYDNFEKSGKINYDDFEKLPFWIANDQFIFKKWEKQQSQKEGWMLDVGCGNGRSAERLTAPYLNVIGIDIAKNMIRKAIDRANKNGKIKHQTFLVGDATNLPFKKEQFHYAITSGVLSQLPNIQQTCSEIQRTLVPEGIYFGLENNKSLFRILFDILNKIFSIWKNEKGKEPEVSEELLKKWHGDNPITIHSYTSVFLPPHIFNWLGARNAEKLIQLTNNIFYLFGMKKHGGLIIFDVQKLAQ